MKYKQYSAVVLSSVLFLPSYYVQAFGDKLVLEPVGLYAIEAKPFDTVLVPTDKDQLQKAQFNSGLVVALSNPLFDVNVDYALTGNMEKAGDTDLGTLSQTVTASMRSSLLNDILSIDAQIDADSAVYSQGDIYHYTISPGFSRSIYKLADLNVNYRYKLAKPSAVDRVEEQKEYSLGLSGTIGKGRLVWSGLYSESELSQSQWLNAENTELINFNSSYRLFTDLHVELSSAIKHRTLLNSSDNEVISEKRFGAGLSWSPAADYSFVVNINKVENSSLQENDLYGEGKFIWSPKHDLELSLGYGDELQNGVRGFIFSTKINFDES